MSGLIIFIVLVVLVGILYLGRRPDSRHEVRPRELATEVFDRAPPPAARLIATDEDGKPVDASDPRVREVAEHPAFLEIAPMLARGDWGSARRFLQKIAYGIQNATSEEQRVFKKVMTVFAEADPMYKLCMDAVRPIVEASPGIKQTALYPHMAAAPDTEHARYVLYFAHELGDVVRKKKGNSYLVFPKGTVL